MNFAEYVKSLLYTMAKPLGAAVVIAWAMISLIDFLEGVSP